MKRQQKTKKIINFKKSSTFISSLLLLIVAAVSVFYLLSCTQEDATAALGGLAAVPLAFSICFIVIAWLAGIFFFVIWIITLVDCVKRSNDEFPSAGENTKVLWILIIVLAGGIGAIIYYFLVMKKMPRKR